MSLIRKHVAVLQAWACLALVFISHSCCNVRFRSMPLSEIRLRISCLILHLTNVHVEDVLQQKLVEDEPIDSRGLSSYPAGGSTPPWNKCTPLPYGRTINSPPSLQGMSTRFVIVARLFWVALRVKLMMLIVFCCSLYRVSRCASIVRPETRA